MASSPNPSRADAFPAGLRVLVVDDDLTWLKILEKMLRKCSYEVTTCSLARAALDMLREKRDRFDIVISDVNMPDMDGFKLLEQVGLEMDLPVIMMSVDGETSRVMKGVQHGACDYLLKPIRMKELKNIWQHVFRKKIHEGKEVETHDAIEDFQFMRNIFNELDDRLLFSGSDLNFSKKRKDVMNKELAEQDFLDPSSVKKARVVWSVDLHQKFVDAVNQIGFDKVGPKKILDLMNVPGLTRENVASHLQKYRLYLSRLQRENEGVACEGGAQSDVSYKDSMGSFCFQSSTSSMQNSSNINIYTGEREHPGVLITESGGHFDNHFDNIAVKEEEAITVIASKSLETRNVKWFNAPCTPPKSSRPTLEKILHEPSISNFHTWSGGTDLQLARCRAQHDLFSLLSGYPREQQLEDRGSSDGLLPITPSVMVSGREEASLSKLRNIDYCENRMIGIPTSQCRPSSVAHQIDTEGKEVSKSSAKSIIMDMTFKNVGSPNIKITYPDQYLIDLIETSSPTSNLTEELTVSPSPDNAYCSLDDYGYFEQNGNDSLGTPQYDNLDPTNLSGNLNESLQFDCDYAFVELTEYSTTDGGLFT